LLYGTVLEEELAFFKAHLGELFPAVVLTKFFEEHITNIITVDNVDNHLQDYRASQPSRPQSTITKLRI
jgi:hypothetical protein